MHRHLGGRLRRSSCIAQGAVRATHCLRNALWASRARICLESAFEGSGGPHLRSGIAQRRRWSSSAGDICPGGDKTPRGPSPLDFEVPVERRSIDEASLKWGRYKRPYLQTPSDPEPPPACLPDEVLPMWVADMDFRSPVCVLQALQERVAHGVFGYTAPSARLNGSVAVSPCPLSSRTASLFLATAIQRRAPGVLQVCCTFFIWR